MTALAELNAAEAMRWHRAAASGDADAVEFWREIFAEEVPCFLCDAPVPPGGRVALFAHPSRGDRMLATVCCAECWALPPMYLHGRVLRVLRAIWPQAKWRLNRAMLRG